MLSFYRKLILGGVIKIKSRYYILTLVLSIFLITGCEEMQKFTQEGPTTSEQRIESPDICEQLPTLYTKSGAPLSEKFVLKENLLGGNFSYDVKTDDVGWATNFPHLTNIAYLPCHGGSKVGENVNYLYCDSIPILERRTTLDEGSLIIKDVEYSYVIENLALKYKESDYYEKWEVVNRSCYQTGFKNYSIE